MKRLSLFLAFVLNASAFAATFAATITVTNTNDSGAGSLRAAIAAVAPGDTIAFSNTTAGGQTNFYDGTPRTIALASALPNVALNIIITGPAPDLLTVMRSTAAGTPAFRIFTISNGTASGPTVTISGLTISNGLVNGSGLATGSGGGIYVDRGTLNLRNVEVTGNSAVSGGGLSNNGLGGSGTVTLYGCAFFSNSASAVGGGAINFGGTLTSQNSTFASCSAQQGGAIYSANSTTSGSSALTLVNSTFTGNSASSGGTAIYNAVSGGTAASVQISNTIFAGDINAGTTITNNGGSVQSGGYNLSNDNGGGFLTAATDQINTDAKLGILQSYPRRTHFYAPEPGSPAVDKGKDFAGNGDQRGLPRPYDYPGVANAAGGDGSDIGAIEVQTPANQQTGSTLTVTSAADHDDGVCSAADCTLREAVTAAYYANIGSSNAGVTINFSSAVHTITLNSALPNLDSNITLAGPGASSLTVQRIPRRAVPISGSSPFRPVITSARQSRSPA